jgi:hypothetical protein
MKTYRTLEDGSLYCEGTTIPIGHRLYEYALELEANGEAEILPYTVPEPTKEELKLEGVEFEGIMCSATSEDMWGLASTKEWIRAGQTTNFEFKNGNVLTLSNDNIDAFEAVWVPFRASFF